MKLSELRTLLDGVSPGDLKSLLVEIYRIVPKKIREDARIDDLLRNPGAAQNLRKKADKRVGKVDIDTLETELTQFLIDAYAQNYLAPNRSVPKAERPKWRFKAKRFFSEINRAADRTNIVKAAYLLEQLYSMLCYACDVVLFSAYDPFQSVGIDQTDFFDAILALKEQSQELKVFIDGALRLLLDTTLNRYSLGSDLAEILVKRLRTPDALELAVERAVELYDERKTGDRQNRDYRQSDTLNRLAEFGFLAYVKLADHDKAIEFLNRHYATESGEIRLFVVLGWLSHLEREDLWLREYEKSARAGIEPRESLKIQYRKLSNQKR